MEAISGRASHDLHQEDETPRAGQQTMAGEYVLSGAVVKDPGLASLRSITVLAAFAMAIRSFAVQVLEALAAGAVRS